MFFYRDTRKRRFGRGILREHRENIDTLPEVVVHYQWKNKKNLSLRVYPDRLVVVRSPAHLSLQRLRAFVFDHLEWIVRHLEKADAKKETDLKAKTPLFYLGTPCKEMDDKKTGKEVRSWYRCQAAGYLPARCLELKRGLPLPPDINLTVSLRWMKSRWGSCRRDGRITLNTALMLCPKHLIDYVILHELAHLSVPAHNAAFYRLLEMWQPDSMEYRKELKRNWSPMLVSLHRLD